MTSFPMFNPIIRIFYIFSAIFSAIKRSRFDKQYIGKLVQSVTDMRIITFPLYLLVSIGLLDFFGLTTTEFF